MRLLVVLLPALLFAVPALAGEASQCTRNKEAIAAYEQAMHVMHRDMMVPYTGDADIDFVAGMIPHHQGAVDMAHIVLKHGNDPEIRKLAEWILTMQESEIGFMKSWLRGRTSPYRAPDADSKPASLLYKAAMEKMHHGMQLPYTGDADRDFVVGMIPHHQAAIEMAEAEKKYGMRPELRKMADEIIRSQQQEIRLMQAWLEKHPAPLPYSAPEKKATKAKKAAKAYKKAVTKSNSPQKEEHKHHDHHASH